MNRYLSCIIVGVLLFLTYYMLVLESFFGVMILASLTIWRAIKLLQTIKPKPKGELERICNYCGSSVERIDYSNHLEIEHGDRT